MDFVDIAGDCLDGVDGASGGRDPIGRLVMRLGLLLTICWLIAGFKSCQDMRYAAWGRQTTGKVTKVTNELTRDGALRGYTIAYSFMPPGAERELGESSVGIAEAGRYRAGQPLEIEFLDGRYPDSRMKGSNNPWWPRFFIGFSIAMLLLVLVLTILARRDEKKPRRRTV